MTTTIHTSRYQNGEEILRLGLVPIRITMGAPRFKLPYTLAGSIRGLAPSRDTMYGGGDFTAKYVAQLDEMGVDEIRRQILAITGDGADPVLLCFEHIEIQGEGSCHRRMFADWWHAQTGENVPEIDDRGNLSQKLLAMKKRQEKAAPTLGV